MARCNWGSGLCPAQNSDGRGCHTFGTSHSGPCMSAKSTDWTTHSVRWHLYACWYHSWGRMRAHGLSRSDMTCHNLGKWRQSNNEWSNDGVKFLFHFVLLHLSYLCIHWSSYHNKCCWDTETDTLRCNGQLLGCDTHHSHQSPVHHTRRNLYGNAHTPVVPHWQSSHWDNHPHTYPHGGSSIGHSLRERERVIV